MCLPVPGNKLCSTSCSHKTPGKLDSKPRPQPLPDVPRMWRQGLCLLPFFFLALGSVLDMCPQMDRGKPKPVTHAEMRRATFSAPAVFLHGGGRLQSEARQGQRENPLSPENADWKARAVTHAERQLAHSSNGKIFGHTFMNVMF